MSIREISENAESYVNHDGGEIDCALVSNTVAEYDPLPTYRQCDLHAPAWKIE